MALSKQVLKDLDHALVRLARRRSVRHLGAQAHAMVESGIEPALFGVLRAVAQEQPVRLSDLAVAIDLDQSTITRYIQQLERAGYVVRTRSEADRRTSMIELSDEGRRMNRRIDAARTRVLSEILAEWSDGDAETLTSLLGRLEADMQRARDATSQA